MIATGIPSLLLAVPSGCPQTMGDRRNFACWSDWRIAEWIAFIGDEQRSDVYMCQGLSRSAAMRRQKRVLGTGFEQRRAAAAERLRERTAPPADFPIDIVGTGHKKTAKYCRTIRFLITDLLRGQVELERRLGTN